nr:hypothetical protein [Tanacetum cinerariifolium]
MVAILEKGEYNIDFHPMVDFIEASPLRIETTKEGTQILATVDGIHRTVTESSLRRNLKLKDKKGINSLPDMKLFENLTLMGYNISLNQKFTFQKATVLASGVVDVSTGSGSIPTTSTPDEEQVPTGSDVVPTASPVVMVESETPKKQKVQEQIDAQVARELEEQLEREDQRRSEQIARDAEIARIHAEEELQIMIDGLDRNNETVAKYLQEYHQFALELPIERRIELITNLVKYQDNYANIYKYQSQQRKPMTKKQKRDYYMAVIKNNLGWKASRIKRKGLNLEQENAKKQKTSEEVPEEAMSPEEVPKEKVYTEGQRSYWKITRLGGSSASYQFFIDLLKHLDREDLNQLWRLMKETLSNRPPISDKEMELWVELSMFRGGCRGLEVTVRVTMVVLGEDDEAAVLGVWRLLEWTNGEWRRVVESGVGDRFDRLVGSLFGFAGKVFRWRRRWVAGGGGGRRLGRE